MEKNDISLDSLLRSPGDAAFEKIWIPLKEAQLLANPIDVKRHKDLIKYMIDVKTQTDTGLTMVSAERWTIFNFRILFQTDKIDFIVFSQFPRFPFLVWVDGKTLRSRNKNKYQKTRNMLIDPSSSLRCKRMSSTI